MSLFKNLGFEDGSVGGAGAASAWSLASTAAAESIAAYFSNGGNLLSAAATMVGSGWTVIGGGSFASNTIDGPPDLDETAHVVTDAVATAVHGILQTVLTSLGIPTDHGSVVSIWARKPTGGPVNFLRIGYEGVDAWFDLTTGNVGTVTGTPASNAVMTSVGGGWYRCHVIAPRSGTFTVTYSAAAVDGATTYLGTGVEVLQLFGPQVNIGLTLTSWASANGGGEIPFEDFEALWDQNDTYFFDLADAVVTQALFVTLLVGTKTFESFEEIWLSNDAYLFSLGPAITANYDIGTPENFEDFEEEWDSNESFSFTLPATATAMYDVGSPQAFEDYEEEWESNDSYLFSLGSVTAAAYDGASPENFEDFEETKAPVVFTTNPSTNTLLAVGHDFGNGDRVNLTSEGVLPFGLSKDVDYDVANINANDFQLEVASVLVTFTDPGGGTHRAIADKSLNWVTFMSTV